MNSSEVGSLHLESDAAHSAKQIMNTKERVMIFSGTYFESSKRTKKIILRTVEMAERIVALTVASHICILRKLRQIKLRLNQQKCELEKMINRIAIKINFFGLLSVEVLSERIIGVYAFCVSEMTFCCSPFQRRSSSSFRSCDLQENHMLALIALTLATLPHQNYHLQYEL
ncbi:hypothetical protein T4D_4397 [Trichinella pseudospiralis]|uniref:Uncharacterized protein n=1 Tax=Trichinella pseudospiralis TaxID=6337 RepID=A0A0V1FJW9_TRIPS|nr:hypothetical protein T4D_3313 [Trichinella pseudospiralis]KRY86361.1 hypothetical protein T4D_4397 [Trichinella pseudospiralis]